jgi:hypothetical protein
MSLTELHDIYGEYLIRLRRARLEAITDKDWQRLCEVDDCIDELLDLRQQIVEASRRVLH